VQLWLEISGGFTGPVGKQTLHADLDRLAPELAAELRARVERIPEDAWGKSFLAPHPRSWDFRHVLRLEDAAGAARAVTFHLDTGPGELSGLARRLTELHSGGLLE
jgi:hypothetical protein